MGRMDGDNISISESPCDDVDALLPPDGRASDERGARQTLRSNDERRAVILKILLLIGTIFSVVPLAFIIPFL